MLAALQSSGGLNALARQLGATPSEALAAAEALLPRLLGAFQSIEGGVPALIALLGEMGGSALASAVMDEEQVDPAPGVAILDAIKSARLLAVDIEHAELALRERMLPMLAMLAGGYLAARAATDHLSNAELARLLVPGESPRRAGIEPI